MFIRCKQLEYYNEYGSGKHVVKCSVMFHHKPASWRVVWTFSGIPELTLLLRLPVYHIFCCTHWQAVMSVSLVSLFKLTKQIPFLLQGMEISFLFE